MRLQPMPARRQRLLIAAVACCGLTAATLPGQAQRGTDVAQSGPDPREIPLPPIAAPLGKLPGVAELPAREAMPDVMVMDDGTRVSERRQWDKRRQSMLGARPVYALLGAPDRLGVNFAHHGHAFTPDDWAAMLDFFDRHLRGKPADRSFDRFPTEQELDAALAASKAARQ